MSHYSSPAASAALSFLFLAATSHDATAQPCIPLTDLLEGFAAKHQEVPVAVGNTTRHSVAILLASKPGNDLEKPQPKSWTLITARLATRGPSAGKVIACFGHTGNEWYPVTRNIDDGDAPIAKASSPAPRDGIVAYLRHNAHEVLQGFAIDSNGYLIELFVSSNQNEPRAGDHGPSARLGPAPATNSFTILVTDPYNYSSIFAAGQDWRQVRQRAQSAPAPWAAH